MQLVTSTRAPRPSTSCPRTAVDRTETHASPTENTAFKPKLPGEPKNLSSLYNDHTRSMAPTSFGWAERKGGKRGLVSRSKGRSNTARRLRLNSRRTSAGGSRNFANLCWARGPRHLRRGLEQTGRRERAPGDEERERTIAVDWKTSSCCFQQTGRNRISSPCQGIYPSKSETPWP